MDHRQLRSFVVLAEELHFGRAALRLNIAQPALSQQIKALERDLHIPLFSRDKRNVSLTFQGQQLVEEARLALTQYQAFITRANSLRQGHSGQLTLGYVGSSILDPAMTALINQYRHDKPHIEVAIAEHNVPDQLRLLLNYQLDIAILRGPAPLYPELEYLELAAHPLVAVLPRQHPLAGAPRIALAALRDERFLIQRDPPGIGLGWSIIDACRRAGFTPKDMHFTRDVSAATGLVAMGMGITLVPDTQRAIAIPEVCYCPLDDPLATTTLILSWQRHIKNNILPDFIRQARARAADNATPDR
ncbi:LysR family transcriptional regulator [Shimwellia pseudoproteus]|uniref:LysR substrate-binding domain-containing protein n=1 Tax=Shimwellia pseudoproteus TaxID=570012 RepID=UPI0018EA64CB|nr:LysR substrate-binding domain-containing protein [Shimwellia pseudoproteus]MBJ3816090.1 LysR family transcriptional regulator [Shimwellia pseudoproteus]